MNADCSACLLCNRQHMPAPSAVAGLSVPVLCYERLLDEAAPGVCMHCAHQLLRCDVVLA